MVEATSVLEAQYNLETDIDKLSAITHPLRSKSLSKNGLLPCIKFTYTCSETC